MLKYIAAIITAALVMLPLTAGATPNLVLNPSFEIGSGSLPYSCGTGCSYSGGGNNFGNCCSVDTTTIPDWSISAFTQQAGVQVPGGAPLKPVPNGVAEAYTSGGS